jgi:hypothetical protein
MNKLFAGSTLLILASAQGPIFEKMRDMAEKSGCERRSKSEMESLRSGGEVGAQCFSKCGVDPDDKEKAKEMFMK